ncbi:hypothetical protein LguiA_022907 [Lonicera macranthoides]
MAICFRVIDYYEEKLVLWHKYKSPHTYIFQLIKLLNNNLDLVMFIYSKIRWAYKNGNEKNIRFRGLPSSSSWGIYANSSCATSQTQKSKSIHREN